MFRIWIDRGGRMEVVRFAGYLAGEALPELEAACRSLKGPVVLDLDQLRWADREGVTAIARLVLLGAELANVPAHVREMLKVKHWANQGKSPAGEA